MTNRGIEYHEQIASRWAARYQKSSFRKREAVFSEALEGQCLKGQRWLDAGCGVGSLSKLLLSRGAEVLGVDGSPKMIEHALTEYGRRSGIEFRNISDLETWQWTGAPFHGVLCSSVLEYLQFPGSMLSNIARWVVPNGLLLLSVPNCTSLLRKAQKSCWTVTRMLGTGGYPSYLAYSRNDFTARSIEELLEVHGFEVIKIVYFGFPARWSSLEVSVLSPLMLVVALRQ